MPAETHSHDATMDRDTLVRLVTELTSDVLADLLPPDAAAGPAARLRDDLGLDDLSIIDLLEGLEELLGERSVGLALADDEFDDLQTVGDVVDTFVAAALADRGLPGDVGAGARDGGSGV